MNLNPEKCPHCEITWVGGRIQAEEEKENHTSDYFTINVILMRDNIGEKALYRCQQCKKDTPMSMWNQYTDKFMAASLITELERKKR